MEAQLIKLKDGKFVVVNDEKFKGKGFVYEPINQRIRMIEGNEILNILDIDKKVIAGYSPLPAISNIDKVFELWKLAKDEKEWELLYQILIDARPSICVHEQSLKNLFETARKDYYSAEMVMGFVHWKDDGGWQYHKTHSVWMRGTKEKYTDKELFHLYQLSLLPESLNIEWDENKNEILKVII